MSNREILCPQCRTALKIERKPDGIFWSCHQCTGMALNLAVLRRCLPPDEVQAFWRQLQSGLQATRPCPSCAQSLQYFTHRVDQQTLELDVCKTCQIVWFDKGEFDALPAKAVPLAEIEDLSPETREKLALLKLQYQTELKDQLAGETDRMNLWAYATWEEMAIGIVYLLIRIALRL